MHNCWDVLEIEPTTDKKTIKRAYTSLVKHCNPETQAAQFQELRQAYENALHYSQYTDDLTGNNDDTNIETLTLEDIELASVSESKSKSLINVEDYENDSPEELFQRDIQAHLSNDANQDPALYFCDKVNAVWEDETRRHEKSEWEKLIASDELLDLTAKDNLWLKMFGFFAFEAEPKMIYSHPNLLIYIVKSFDEIFGWSQDELRLQRYFDEESIQKVLCLIDSKRFLNSNISANPAFEAPSVHLKWVIVFIIVLLLLTNIFEGLLKGRQTLDLGSPNISPDETELTPTKTAFQHFQQAEQYFKNQDWNRAIYHYSIVIDIDKNSTASLFNRGTAYYHLNNLISAEQDFRLLSDIKSSPELKARALKMLGVTHLQLRRNKEALNELNQSIALSPFLQDAHGARAQIYAQQEKLALALKDLNTEIKNNPTAYWYKLRAWVHDQMHQAQSMCSDLNSACSFKNQDACQDYRSFCSV